MRSKTLRAEPLSLFHPAKTLPDWANLPAPLREQALALILQILEEHHRRTASRGKERNGE